PPRRRSRRPPPRRVPRRSPRSPPPPPSPPRSQRLPRPRRPARRRPRPRPSPRRRRSPRPRARRKSPEVKGDPGCGDHPALKRNTRRPEGESGARSRSLSAFSAFRIRKAFPSVRRNPGLRTLGVLEGVRARREGLDDFVEQSSDAADVLTLKPPSNAGGTHPPEDASTGPVGP